MPADQGQERTEQATPKRLRESREKGQVARSRELATLAVMMAGAGSLFALGDGLIDGLANMITRALQVDRAQLFDASAGSAALSDAILDALGTFVPLLVLVTLAAVLAPMALGGWVFSAKAFGFKWEKLDPIKGLGKLFSARGLMELVKALAKFAVVSTVAVILMLGLVDVLLNLGREPIGPALAHSGHVLGWSFLVISMSLIVITVVDVPFQIWNHAKELKMTRQEIKDEFKETEGRPEVKSRIRQLQRELSQRRMMEEVPKADVIVTNPVRFAIALRYDTLKGGAPVVVAKGRDLIAAHIREVGTANNVPMMSAPPLARALYFSVELGGEIPAGLYLAVAQVLAYVFELKRAHAESGPAPTKPTDLPIPDEFQR
ncbi:MAG TPA: flagellar type III secretion system protein FlhB [Acidiferrobacteraceae bacterium]|nr:flagellar type III secretion system protein FlhB [Acidiferrobacteraceae bacterium]